MGGRREAGHGQKKPGIDAETPGADRKGPARNMEATGTDLVTDVGEESVDESGRPDHSRPNEQRGDEDAPQPDDSGGQDDPIDQAGHSHGPILSFYGLGQKGRHVLN